MAKKYVLGFAFSDDRTEVVLIRKNRPEWMKGLLNGVGGKIESSDESPLHAMSREFVEETGIKRSPHQWSQVAVLYGEYSEIHIFKTFTDDIQGAASETDEVVGVYNVRDLALGNYYATSLPNITWLIPMCLAGYAEREVTYYIKEEAINEHGA